jgi:hypothetical protein
MDWRIYYGMRSFAERWIPTDVRAALVLFRRSKGQGSLEYIMMISAASMVVLIALAMIIKFKGAVSTSTMVNGTNTSVYSAIAGDLSALSRS